MTMDEVYRTCYKTVYGYLFTLCKDKSLSEELTAETFFKAVQSYKNFDGNCKVTTWLCQIAKNEYFKYLKKQKRIDDTSESTDYADCKNLEESFTDRETAMRIHKHLHCLKEPYKEVFSLRVFAELSFAEIGIVLGKTENWARVTYYRAKIKLLKELEDEDE